MEGLDETFDAIIFVGYHAKADSPRGLFAHTGSGVIRDLQINGQSVGEGGMNAALAAWYGVPVVAVSGDDVAVAEVKEDVPGDRGVMVKRAINVRAVELRPLAEARRDIQARRPRRRPGGEEAGARASAAVSGPHAIPELHLSGSRDGVSARCPGRAGHRRISRRPTDARGVSPDPRALPIHQHGLTERPPGAIPMPDAVGDLEARAAHAAGRWSRRLRCRVFPMRDDGLAVALRLDRA